MSTTPRALGYRWPAEWEPHAGTWLSWPRNRETWPGGYAPIPRCFAALVRAIAQFEPVNVLAGGDARAAAEKWVGSLPNVTLYDIATNDAWARDHGPTFLSGPGEPALVDWQYNAWGGKYPPFDRDNQVPAAIAQATGRQSFVSDLVMEGGSIEGNGQGVLLTTTTCLLNPNRNPGRTQAAIEQTLREYLAVDHFCWLSGGEIEGDDTDGHIDQLARFVSPDTLVAAREENERDVNFMPLQENYRQLNDLRDAQGRPFNVVPLPMPAPKYFSGQRMPACYANFYIVNGGVIVPQFDDPADHRALAVLREVLPGRDVVGLSAIDMIWGLGAWHCLTQQEPR
ncbi:agmatine deiminase family protein [Lignipirellula cremea]|nr:agmatine deiminase family protein [Lignipirellula cremea]